MSRRDTVPAELVAPHLRDWLERSNGLTALDLARRAGVDDSLATKIKLGTYKYDLGFDIADRLFCAMGSPNLWYCDPELAAIYESACKGADGLQAIKGMSKREKDAERARYHRQKAAA